MNGDGKSDRPILPGKRPNKAVTRHLRRREWRKGDEPRGTCPSKPGSGRSTGRPPQHALEQVRQKARKDKDIRFTTLWHHVYDVARLRLAYLGLKRRSAPGVDGETWQQYGQNLEANLQDLSARLRRGAYRARPVLRVYIPKSDGRQRPIGVTVLEDKIVQRATVEVLNAIYETDFLGFSYGFRPGRSQHDALDAVAVGIAKKKVNWVFDADIRGFFDALSHEWTVKFVEHRISDTRVLRHIKKWLKAGVLEDGQWMATEEGSPQGGCISPLLANIYLHYAFDLWADQWRRRHAKGEVIIIRYADDVIVGFQYRQDAIRFHRALAERFRRFNLELHPEKTRLLEFGRFAAGNRARRGEGKPETFDFLGFTHICGKTRKGKFSLQRRSIGKRMRKKLVEISEGLRKRMHIPIPEQGKWLRQVVGGWFQYHAVPLNGAALSRFRDAVSLRWYKVLMRRSQRGNRLKWERMKRLIGLWLPKAKILHPYPNQRLRV